MCSVSQKHPVYMNTTKNIAWHRTAIGLRYFIYITKHMLTILLYIWFIVVK